MTDFPSLISTDWLAEHLGEPGLVILDATRHLPDAGRDARAEYESAHIPGARFLDLASLTDTASPVPQAMPSPQQFSKRLGELGVTGDGRIVVYDDSALKTAARAWFMLVAYGLTEVAILDGGLAKWRSEGQPLESGEPEIELGKPIALGPPERVRFKADILANLETQAEQVLDARSADRVFGSGTDPVHGGQNGRIPGSLNLPFGKVFNEDGTYISDTAQLRGIFADAGVDLAKPIVTSCGR